MNNQISAMVDGHGSDVDIDLVLRRLKNDAAAREEWELTHLIGDSLRGESMLFTRLTRRVMEALEDEPTVLAPPPRKETDRRRMLLSLAASAAGVAVVGWVALGGRPSKPILADQNAFVVAVPPQVMEDPVPPVAALASSERVQEYLVAHHAQSSFTHVAPAVGGVRSVAMVRSVP